VSVIVIGVDPGTVKMGVGVIRLDGKRMEFVRGELLEAKKSAGLAERLAMLKDDFVAVLNDVYRMENTGGILAGIEEGFRGGMGDLSLAEARGVARMLLACNFGNNLRGYAPGTVKKAVTGNGGSTKDSVAFAVKHTLKMKVAPQADIADALAVAVTRAMDKEE
jgi:crossover junction endodeoxyribonuclease RuvC